MVFHGLNSLTGFKKYREQGFTYDQMVTFLRRLSTPLTSLSDDKKILNINKRDSMNVGNLRIVIRIVSLRISWLELQNEKRINKKKTK